jgi:hypothetical protein
MGFFAFPPLSALPLLGEPGTIKDLLMYLSIKQVMPHEDFNLSIVFDDGAEGILDIKPYLDFGVFGTLKITKTSSGCAWFLTPCNGTVALIWIRNLSI